jgi:radical SAM-linked protein
MGAKKNQPEQNQAPVVQRVRLRYAKRGPLRFTSHRDFARAFERAVRRAGVPVAYSQGFSPHPKISYASAAPTGVASEAEYLELGLQAEVEPEQVRAALDEALSPGLDVLEAVAVGPGGGPSLADRIDASIWRIDLDEVDPGQVEAAVSAFLGTGEVLVERMTKQGRRRFDVRAAVVALTTRQVDDGVPGATGTPRCAILDLVVRQVTPSVRPDDVLAGLRVVADLEPSVPPRVIRLAQGRLTAQGEIVDPLRADDVPIPDGSLVGGPSD